MSLDVKKERSISQQKLLQLVELTVCRINFSAGWATESKAEKSGLVCWNSESQFQCSLGNVLVWQRLLFKSPLYFSDLLNSHRLPLFCQLILKVGNFLNYVRTSFVMFSCHYSMWMISFRVLIWVDMGVTSAFFLSCREVTRAMPMGLKSALYSN